MKQLTTLRSLAAFIMVLITLPCLALQKGKKDSDVSGPRLSVLIGPGVTQKGFALATENKWAFTAEGSVYIPILSKKLDEQYMRMYYGLGFNYWFFGSKTFEVNTPNNAQYSSYTNTVTWKAYGVDLAKPRIEFFPEPLSIFIEGVGGFRWYKGVQKIEYVITNGGGTSPNPESDKQHLISELPAYYGFGTGMIIKIKGIGIELKYSRLMGRGINYVDPQSASFDQSGNLTGYELNQTADTNMDLFQAGITFAVH